MSAIDPCPMFVFAIVMFSGSAQAQQSAQEQPSNAIIAAQCERIIFEAQLPDARNFEPDFKLDFNLDLKLDLGAIIDDQALADQSEIRMGALDQTPAQDSSATAPAETEGASEADDVAALAAKAQNPIADMISVPFKNIFNFDVGPNKVVQYILEAEPVIPVHLNEDWNLITRTIIPMINSPSPAPGISSEFGLGDIQFSGFFSPSKPSEITWGAGPIFQFPTATDDLLGQGKWCAGPTVVAVWDHRPWLGGVLASQLWSFAGESDREYVNQMLIQPFVNYNMQHGWYLLTAPIITADWEADSSNQWTLPVGGGIGWITKIGDQHVNFNLQAYYNAVRPDNASDWQLLFEISLLFPQ